MMELSAENPPRIRRATAPDAAALALIGAATFLETYSELIPGADLVAHCAERHSAAIYAGWLADPRVCLWIAETHTGAPVGYLVLTPATLPVGAPHPADLEVLRIYVLSRYQKTRLGRGLMRHAIAEAEARAAPRLVLGLYHGNQKALAFYRSQGFALIGRRRFTVGTATFEDLVAALELGKKAVLF